MKMEIPLLPNMKNLEEEHAKRKRVHR